MLILLYMVYNLISTLENIMNISEFDFANQNNVIGHAEIANYSFFKIDATTRVLSHGDTEEFDRVFLIAAPTSEHAKVWAELNYLIGGMCNSHQELLDELNEQTIDDDETNCIASQFIGCVDVGDYKYRQIDRIIGITKEYAESMYKLGDFYETNLGNKPFG